MYPCMLCVVALLTRSGIFTVSYVGARLKITNRHVTFIPWNGLAFAEAPSLAVFRTNFILN